MSVDTLNEFKGHGSCAMNGIKSAAWRTETAFTAEWDKFNRTTRRTPIHSTAERRIAAMNHFFNIFESGGAELERVLDFFVMIWEDLLQNVHSNIVQQKRRQKHPLMNEGGAGGVDAGIARFLVQPESFVFWIIPTNVQHCTWLGYRPPRPVGETGGRYHLGEW